MRPYIASLVRRLTALIACMPLLLTAGAVSAGLDDLEPAGIGIVAAVIDGDTLRLADGRVVRLAGIAAPKPEAGQDEAWAKAARDGLDAVAAGREVAIARGELERDRHGRLLAHLHVIEADGTNGTWLQGALLERGLVRVSTTAATRALAAQMLALEQEARAASRGLWADPGHRIRTPEDVGAAIDSFQIVEGLVLSARLVGSRTYVNFGPDYTTDFTVALDAAARRLFRDAGIDPTDLAGRRVRARGWVRSFDGPRIDVTHPEQIEVLP